MVRAILHFLLLTGISWPAVAAEGVWTTTADRSRLLSASPLERVHGQVAADAALVIDHSRTFQSMLGFGGTLTDGSVAAINLLPEEQRQRLLDELFGVQGEGMGATVLRLSIGASDLSERAYTYNDAPLPDPELEHFSLAPAREQLIPLLKAIRQRNERLVLMATPWSAPAWMKDNRSLIGGQLQPEYFPVYAAYLVKYLTGFRDEGLPIDYLTVQNEPLHDGNNPSMLMTAQQQAEFMGRHIGPAIDRAGLAAKLLAYDHNCDRPGYPLSVLGDAAANRYVAGSAFHLYAGTPDAMSLVHERFPGKEIHFTEQWVSADGDFGQDLFWHAENVLIGATRNWARTVLEWNIASDRDYKPHTAGGCDRCLGAVSIGDIVRRNVAYYILAHGGRFVPRGSLRVQSSATPDVTHVAFLTPEKQVAIVVLNKSDAAQRLRIQASGEHFLARIAPLSLTTVLTPRLKI